MSDEKLYEYIRGLKDSPIQFEHKPYGWDSGAEYLFEIAGNKYSVGGSHIIEDADDWAQAESYEVTWCRCNDKDIDADEVHKLIENYKSITRDRTLNELGI
jgi:hypothetical protein